MSFLFLLFFMSVFLFYEERFYVREIFKQSHFIQFGYRRERIFGGVSAANVYELAPVVVTATKTAESLEKVPASVSVVTAKDIEDHNCIRILSPHLRWGTRWSRSFA